MEQKELKTRYATINEDVTDDTGVFTDSIVEYPAIEVSFISLSKINLTDEKLIFKADKPQQKLVGPILIPNLPILRKDNRTGELYNLIFTEEEIVKINRKRQKLKNINSVNVEHNDNLKLDGVVSEETWIILDPANDKANALGFDLPKGTLMTSIYIEDLELFNKLKENYVGFSIEGIFNIVDEVDEAQLESISDYPQVISDNAAKGIKWNDEVNNKCATQTGKIRAQQLANREPISIETIKRMYSYLSRAKEYFDPNNKEACGTISYYLWGGEEALGWAERTIKNYENKNQKTSKMKKLIKKLSDLFKINLAEFTLQDGTIVNVDDQTMDATINGEPAPDGTHILQDVISAIVVQDGKLVEVIEIPDPESESTPTIDPATATPAAQMTEEPSQEVNQVTYKLMDGSEIFVREQDGLAFKDNEIAPDGEYELEDGRILVIKDGRVEEVMTMKSLLSKLNFLSDELFRMKFELSKLSTENEDLEEKLEKFTKTTRALPKAEVTPTSKSVEVKKSDLMVNKLKALQNLK